MKPVSVLSATQAADLVSDGATIAISGCENILLPNDLLAALGERFKRTGAPSALTEIHPIVVGMGEGKGLENLAYPGMVRRAIGSGFSYLKTSRYTQMLKDNEFEAHIMPMGTVFQMFRDCAAGRKRTLTTIGLDSFVDPAVDGGRVNDAAKQSLARTLDIEGDRYLAYDVPKVDVALLRGTTSDEHGNISFEDEPVSLGARIMAQAAKASGGKVIVQVRRLTQSGHISPRQVEIPGLYVDAVVVSANQSVSGGELNPCLTGQVRLPLGEVGVLESGLARIIASRASAEVGACDTVNLGVGIPVGIPKLLHERAEARHATYFPEHGSVGGIPGPRDIFGTNINPDAIIDSTSVFDSFHGGGLDITFLGCAQIDAFGNVNVSKFNGIVPGCGGFIDIVSRTPRVVFCGAFSADGLDVAARDGRLIINREGRTSKFVERVEQITFPAQSALQKGQAVLYVTERAVFRLKADGLHLLEVAPGIDIARDVTSRIPFAVSVSRDLVEMNRRHFQ